MSDLGNALSLAVRQITSGDAELYGIVALSLRVSMTASLIALVLGAPLGATLAMTRFHGRRGLIVVLHALIGLPPVVVGLVIYLLLSRSGPLGDWGFLFTPGAMIAAQTVLAAPIITALVERTLALVWAEHGDALKIDGAPFLRAMATILAIGRTGLLTAFLAAFGRAIAEVGAILVVGGNIRGFTRTMTTAIALETTKGDLPQALALGLILVTLSLLVSAAAFRLEAWMAGDRDQ